jgi:hypothetical protein
MDDKLEPVPTGQTGELCFGGQLATGYFGMPQLTAEKFLHSETLGRIYRTGDLARWKQGVIEICGRADRQVKIRGVRVEPEEVESALKGFRRPLRAVRQGSFLSSSATGRAALIDAEAPAPTDAAQGGALIHVGCVATTGASPELVAFVSPALDPEEMKLLKEHLAAKLPTYYQPKYIYSMEELPLMPNGKVNLRALVEEATSNVEREGLAGEQVLDSLGRMRNMSKAQITETQVIHRCYAYWMIGVMSDHWNLCGMGGAYCAVENIKGVVPPWVELFMRQLGNDQDMFGFIFLGALQDSQMPPGQTKIRMKIGYGTLFSFAVYLMIAFPIPQLITLIFGNVSNGTTGITNYGCDSNWPSASCSGHRWYLFMVVYCHICIALCQLLRMPGWLQAMGHFALCLFASGDIATGGGWGDLCSAGLGLPKWLRWVCCWVFPYADVQELPSGEYLTHCPVMYNWIEWYALFYVLAFYYSRPGMKLVTGLVERAGCNSSTWAIAAFATSSVLGSMQAAFHYPNTIVESGIGGPGFKWWYVPLEFGVNSLQPLLVALSMAWLPFNTTWWGNTTLGNYSVHFYFMMWMVQHVPNVLTWMSDHNLQGLPQVMVLVAIPFFFQSTLGAAFHYLLLTPSMIARRLQKMIRRRPQAQAAPPTSPSCPART